MTAKKKAASAKHVRKQARAWMVMNEIKIIDIQDALNMTHAPICHTLSGARHNRRVLAYLLDRGCPTEYLALPQDMRKDKHAASRPGRSEQ